MHHVERAIMESFDSTRGQRLLAFSLKTTTELTLMSLSVGLGLKSGIAGAKERGEKKER